MDALIGGHLDLYVHPHARQRARERFPGFKAARIVDEVRAAFLEGRVSPHPPPGIGPQDNYPDCLYASTPDGSRVYAMELDEFYSERFVVVTTLRPSDLTPPPRRVS